MDGDARFLLSLALAAAGRPVAEGHAAPAEALKGPRLAHVTLRRAGKRLASHWSEGKTLADLFATLPGLAEADTVELSLAHPRQRLNRDDLRRAALNRWRGLQGIELRAPGKAPVRIPPLELLTRNLGPDRAIERLAKEAGLPPETATDLFQFRADDWLIDLTSARATRLYRGQELVGEAWIGRDGIADLAAGMQDWLVRQVGADGKTTYKYWPSRGDYSTANNMIRQFMGSACLALAAARDPGAATKAMEQNFRYNFKNFYHERRDFGVIDEEGKIKLGAAAVALQAILNRPDPAPWQPQADRLCAFLKMMQNDDGSFRTFLEPAWRTDCENFYPGEAMLALAMLNQRAPDMDLTARLWRGFGFYRAWHRANRNPAFVPWHTQALCLFHQATGAPELAEFVFEMNDWLLAMQQGTEAPPDVQGEFFDPRHPDYGPPHASATGVYMEGLIEAWSLARRLGEMRRAEAYRRALLWGARSLRQLQYRDDTSMFYLGRKDRVRGAIRTAVWDNTIRIDNVQHGLMALWKMLDRFGAADFSL